MLTHRYQRVLLLGLLIVISFYLLLPLGVSYLLAEGLRQYGYQHVIIQLGYPGWNGMRIPVVSFQQDLGQESLLLSLTDAELHYHPANLIHGHIDRVVLPDVAVQILHTAASRSEEETVERATTDESPWSLLTAGDLMRRLPLLPFDELRVERVTMFRERATGPLRKMTISGVLVQQEGELGGHLSFQGQDTAPYGLTVAGHSATTWSATLASQRPPAAPIISWQSHAHPEGGQIHVEGRLEMNIRELAPFIALLVPIGPELGRVTGQVAMRWAGTAAEEVSLLSVWEDPRTRLDGKFQAVMTLPALQGVARDIALSCEGQFAGNATEVGWTLNPGVFLTATVNAQPRVIPEAVRMLLPRGDQPVRMEHRQPVKGILYWAEDPVRITADGPMLLTYGQSPGPLAVEVETIHAEGIGRELAGAQGTFRVEGELSKRVTEQLFANEAVGGFRGTVKVVGSRVRAVVLPASFLMVKQIDQGTLSVPRATLQLAEALSVQCDLSTGHCSTGPASIDILVPTLRVMGRSVHWVQSTVMLQQAEAAGTSWNLQAALQVAGLTLDVPQADIAATNWKMKLAANHAGLKADVRVDAPAHEGLITAKIEQPFGAAPASLHGTVGPVSFDAGDRRFSKLVKGLPIEVTDGHLSSVIEASWVAKPGDAKGSVHLTEGTATIIAENLSGRYREYQAQGVSTTFTLRADGTGPLIMAQPSVVKIASVQTGVEVTNIRMLMQAAWKAPDVIPLLDVKDFQCDVFGGAVTTPGVRFDWTQPSRQVTFSLRRLDLAKVLSTEEQKGLEGTGTLNGTLPVVISSHGLTVDAGSLEAEPSGGVIRYASMTESSKVITESDSQLHLVAQALNNFHYTVMRVGVEYAENGTLNLGIRLEGKNPDLKKSPPIHFNLSVQEHVPTLLKSLRLVQEIEDTVQKKFKQPGVS